MLTIKYKIINFILTWSIPFLWGALIQSTIQTSKPKVMFGNNRRKYNSSSKTNSDSFPMDYGD